MLRCLALLDAGVVVARTAFAALAGAAAPGASLERARKPKRELKRAQVPGMIWLAGGTPAGSFFPMKSIKVTLTDDTEVELSPGEVCAQDLPRLQRLTRPPDVR